MFVCQQKNHAEALPGRVLFQRWRQTMSAAVNHCGLPIGWCLMCLQSSSILQCTHDRTTHCLCNLCGLSRRQMFFPPPRKTTQRRVKISCRRVVEHAKTCAATWLWSPQKTLAYIRIPLDLVFRCGVLADLRLSWHVFCLCSFSDHELNPDA